MEWNGDCFELGGLRVKYFDWKLTYAPLFSIVGGKEFCTGEIEDTEAKKKSVNLAQRQNPAPNERER
jgi:hypothetical protein